MPAEFFNRRAIPSPSSPTKLPPHNSIKSIRTVTSQSTPAGNSRTKGQKNRELCFHAFSAREQKLRISARGGVCCQSETEKKNTPGGGWIALRERKRNSVRPLECLKWTPSVSPRCKVILLFSQKKLIRHEIKQQVLIWGWKRRYWKNISRRKNLLSS